MTPESSSLFPKKFLDDELDERRMEWELAGEMRTELSPAYWYEEAYGVATLRIWHERRNHAAQLIVSYSRISDEWYKRYDISEQVS